MSRLYNLFKPSQVNTKKTIEKRKATGRSTKELMKTYRDRKGSQRGYR